MRKIISSTVASMVLITGFYMACSGCGEIHDFDYVTPLGIGVIEQSHPVNIEDVDRIFSETIHMTIKHFGWGSKAERRLFTKEDGYIFALYLEDEVMNCNTVNGAKHCTGLWYKYRRAMQVWHNNDCLDKTSFAHEVIHYAMDLIHGDADGGHVSGVWMKESNMRSLSIRENCND